MDVVTTTALSPALATAFDLTRAYIAQNPDFSGTQALDMVLTMHNALSSLNGGAPPAPEPIAAVPTPRALVPAVPIESSYTDDFIISLEDGKHYTMLKRHLTVLGMTPETYRAKWGLRADYPMVAPAYSIRKRKEALDVGLGRPENKLGINMELGAQREKAADHEMLVGPMMVNA